MGELGGGGCEPGAGVGCVGGGGPAFSGWTLAVNSCASHGLQSRISGA